MSTPFTFGSSTSTGSNASTSSSFAFGAPTSTALPTPFSASTPTFGAPTATPAPVSTFGAPPPATNNIFGAATAAPTFTTATPTFPASTPTVGGTPAFGVTPSFGTPTTNPTTTFTTNPTPSPFGTSTPFGTTNPTTTAPTFGAPFGTAAAPGAVSSFTTNSLTPSPFGTTTQPSQALPHTPVQQFEGIFKAFNPADPMCQTKFMFYNRVTPDEAKNLTRPANVDALLWEQANANNPDPSRFIPVQAVGWEAVKLRLQSQDTMIKEQQAFAKNAQQQLEQVRQQREIRSIPALEQYKRQHMILCQKLLKLVNSTSKTIGKGQHLVPQEETFRGKFISIQKELNNTAIYKSRLTELMALSRTPLQQSVVPNTFSEDVLMQIGKQLSSHVDSLQQLEDLINKGGRDLDLMLSAFQN